MTPYEATNRAGKQLTPAGHKVFGSRLLAWLKKRQKRNGKGLKVTTIRNTGNKIVRAARQELGVHEVPAGSNTGPIVQMYLNSVGYRIPGAWCAAFASYVVHKGGGTMPGGGSASCYILRTRAQSAGKWHRVGTVKPKPGWVGIVKKDEHAIVVIDMDKNGVGSQIAGNTSLSDGLNPNGGNVAEHHYGSGVLSGFIETW